METQLFRTSQPHLVASMGNLADNSESKVTDFG